MKSNRKSFKSSSFVSSNWFKSNNINVSKQFRIDVNGEFQMLKKQIDKLMIGYKMSHI